MTDCAALRARIVEAKRASNRATIDNAFAEDHQRPEMHSDADLDALRLAVDIAVLEARSAGCEVDDLVGRNVGSLE